jgi:hypothetical protein
MGKHKWNIIALVVVVCHVVLAQEIKPEQATGRSQDKGLTLAYREGPLYKGKGASSMTLVELARDDKVDLIQIGFKTSLNAGTQQKYDGRVRSQFSANSMAFKLGITVSPEIQFYSETVWDSGYLLYPTPIAPFFVNANNNSRLVLYQGYVVLGNLKKSPFYTYFGQARLPYASNFAASFATNLATKMQAVTQRALAVGYIHDGGVSKLHSEVFVFNGDTRVKKSPDNPTLGIHIGGSSKIAQGYSLEFKTGLLSNIADADGFQTTNSSIASTERGDTFDYGSYSFDVIDDDMLDLISTQAQLHYYYGNFTGFATSLEFEKIQKRVPGASIALKWQIPFDVSISAAYSAALKSFDPLDLSFTSKGPFSAEKPPNKGARPSSWNAYISKKYLRDFMFYIGYERTAQALVLNMPKQRTVFGLTKQINPFISGVIEVRIDKNYGVNDDARGPYNKGIISGTEPVGYYSKIPAALGGQLGKTSTSISGALKVNF